MRTAYLVLGYGVPDDIFTDANYCTYLRIVLNAIWSDPADTKIVLFAGGRTDLRPPYRRTEAGEMLKFFRHWARRRDIHTVVNAWEVMGNPETLGVPESLMWFISYVKPRNFDVRRVFCEATRQFRLEALSQRLMRSRVFYEGFTTIGVDFDTSANRYRPADDLKEREVAELDLDTWALKSPANLRRYRGLRVERLKFLRAAGPKRHVQAVRAWEQRESEVREGLGIPV